MAVGDSPGSFPSRAAKFPGTMFCALHHAGRLGKKLLRVEHLMHAATHCHAFGKDTSMPDVFQRMSAKKLA